MKVVLVAFSVKFENSLCYKKMDDPTGERVAKELLKAANLGADFVSVRFVKGDQA